MANLSERILKKLRDSKRLSEGDIQKAMSAYTREGEGRLKDILVGMGLVTEKDLLSLVSGELNIPYISLSRYKIHHDLARMIPEKMARKHRIVPLSMFGGTLTVAMLDPFNIFAIDDVAIATKLRVECVISAEKDIDEAINRLYTRETEDIAAIAEAVDMAEEKIEFVKDEEDLSLAQSRLESSEAPIVRMVDLLIREALKRKASDIHIEPYEKKVRVRYRVDGRLEEVLTIPKQNQNAVITRIRIMSRLDITENRVPQDGRFKIKLHEKEVDFRVSVLPVDFGNKVVMRILDKSALSVGLDHLGFFPESLSDFKSAIAKPYGMILITGPTGSGKSTTLYSVLSQLNRPDKNIITVEDPIEYQVKGITQIQIRPEIGLDFASSLRAIVRQSPDVVMVGEIRDFETADIAIKASLTGQLVLSTLHTNDAVGAVTRLMDMGIEPFLIASSVIMVAAQRLCRKVCPFCREKTDIPKEVFERLGVSVERAAAGKTRSFYQGKGCARCNKSGFMGRMGVLETVPIDDGLKDLIMKRSSSIEIKKYALERGMTTLREDALKKFVQGSTTLDEVIRVTSEDESG